MSTNKKYPTVKVGLTIHNKRMKELTKGKRHRQRNSFLYSYKKGDDTLTVIGCINEDYCKSLKFIVMGR